LRILRTARPRESIGVSTHTIIHTTHPLRPGRPGYDPARSSRWFCWAVTGGYALSSSSHGGSSGSRGVAVPVHDLDGFIGGRQGQRPLPGRLQFSEGADAIAPVPDRL